MPVRHAPGVSSDQTIAETLPRLYREVLDGLARLEELGARSDATRFRAEAIAGYSRAWDAACHKRLEQLLGRIDSTVRHLEQRQRLSLA
jgi:transcription initiation factor IIE alpha subunit